MTRYHFRKAMAQEAQPSDKLEDREHPVQQLQMSRARQQFPTHHERCHVHNVIPKIQEDKETGSKLSEVHVDTTGSQYGYHSTSTTIRVQRIQRIIRRKACRVSTTETPPMGS